MTPVGLPRKDPWLLGVTLVVVVYATLVLWLSWSAAGAPPDTLDYAEVARSLVRGQGDTVNRVTFHTSAFPAVRHPLETHGILHPLLIAPLFLLWGPQLALVHLPNVLMIAALGVLCFSVGRFVAGRVAGLVAAGLVLGHKSLLFLGILGGDDIGGALFTFAALAFLAKGVRSGTPRHFVVAGICAGIGVLEKQSGLTLPVVFGLVLLGCRSEPGARFRNWLIAIVPTVFAMALYAWRNYRIWGTLGYSHNAMEWLAKADFAAYFRYYERPPTLSDVVATLGPSRMLSLTRDEFVELAEAIVSDPILAAGILATPILFKRNRPFALGSVIYMGTLVILLCVVHHVEFRYLSPVIALASVALGEVFRVAVERLEAFFGGSRAPRLLAAIVGVLAILYLLQDGLRLARFLGRRVDDVEACADTLHFLQSETDPSSAILTADPWWVSWRAERPAVMSPTNGARALLQVVKRYDVAWAITGPTAGGGADVHAALQNEEVNRSLNPVLTFDGQHCDIYRLSP